MHYQLHGQTDPLAPVVLLSAGLGGSGQFWLPQLDLLAEHFRVVIYDHRGTGANPAQLPPGYSMQHMADEVRQLLDLLGIERCHFIGHALGGMIGLTLALTAPARVASLVLVNSWMLLNAHTRRCFEVRKDLLMNSGVQAYIRAQPLFLYPADWLAAHQGQMEREEAHLVTHFQGRDNLLRRLQALMDTDFSARLTSLKTPTFVIASKDDMLVPWCCSTALAAAIPAATLQLMPWGGHAMSVSNPQEFNRLLSHWYQSLSPPIGIAT